MEGGDTMLCKVFEHYHNFGDMQSDINQWLTSNKGIEVANVFQQGGIQSGEDPGAMLCIVTTLFYRQKF